MFTEEVKNLLFQVITSWQVIAVTVVLIIYVFIVRSVARLYRGRRQRKIPILPKEKPQAASAPVPAASSGGDDDLGLEEEE